MSAREGTATTVVMRISANQFQKRCGERSSADSGRHNVAPLVIGKKISRITASNDNAQVCANRSPGRIPNSFRCQSSDWLYAPCHPRTPFGVPVEPEV